MKEPLISVRNLKVSFYTKAGEIRSVDGISYDIEKGKVLGVVGESGCGKSVGAYAMMGLLQHPGKIKEGSIIFKGQDISKFSEDQFGKIRGKNISMIFQEPMTALNPVLSIGFQITEQIIKHLKTPKKEALEKAVHLLDLVGIPSPRKRYSEYPHQLSGGMKQRAMIAMALSCDPDFLIADEPTTALDVTTQAQILDLIQNLQAKYKMAIQFITHDMGVISELADEVIVLYAGKIVEKASCEVIFKSPQHPYTKGLMASIPKFRERVNELYTIPGSVPAPLELPVGCDFANRCTFVSEKCLRSKPEITEVNPGQFVACFHPEAKP